MKEWTWRRSERRRKLVKLKKIKIKEKAYLKIISPKEKVQRERAERESPKRKTYDCSIAGFTVTELDRVQYFWLQVRFQQRLLNI